MVTRHDRRPVDSLQVADQARCLASGNRMRHRSGSRQPSFINPVTSQTSPQAAARMVAGDRNIAVGHVTAPAFLVPLYPVRNDWRGRRKRRWQRRCPGSGSRSGTIGRRNVCLPRRRNRAVGRHTHHGGRQNRALAQLRSAAHCQQHNCAAREPPFQSPSPQIPHFIAVPQDTPS